MNAGESLGLIGVVLAIGFAIGKSDTTPSLPPPNPTPPLAPPTTPTRPPMPPMGGSGSLSPMGSYSQRGETTLRQGEEIVVDQKEIIRDEVEEFKPPQKGVDLDAIPEKPVDDSFKFDGMYKI